MNESLNESLSALADGRITELELHRVLAATERDDALRARWARHHALGEALRGEQVSVLNLDFADRIRAAVDEEPAYRAGWWQRLAASPSARPAAGFAVAASVAMAVFFGGQQWLNQGEGPVQGNVLALAPAAVSSVAPQGAGAQLASFGQALPSAEPMPAMTAEELAAEEARLQSYLLMHAEHVAEGQPGGMLPYARVTRYEMNQ